MYNEYNDGTHSRYTPKIFRHCTILGVNPNRVYKQIPLGEILALIPYDGPPVDPKFPPHCFEIRTIQNVTYCVGENLEALSGGAPPTKLPRHGSQFGVSGVQVWFQVIVESKSSHTFHFVILIVRV